LPDDGSQRSLILIHDGPDNCQQDVCAAAAELSAAGIAAHVVSLGLSADDLAETACIAEATGGRRFKADTAEQVEAGLAEALRLAGGNPAEVVALAPPSPAGRRDAAAPPPPPVPASGPAALHLRALWA